MTSPCTAARWAFNSNGVTHLPWLDRPTLRLLPGERLRLEAQARAEFAQRAPGWFEPAFRQISLPFLQQGKANAD